MIVLRFADRPNEEPEFMLNGRALIALVAELGRQGEDVLAARLTDGDAIEEHILEAFLERAPETTLQQLILAQPDTAAYLIEGSGYTLEMTAEVAASVVRETGLRVERVNVDVEAKSDALWLQFLAFAQSAAKQGGISIT